MLAVDDDALVLMNTAMILEDLGHTVLQTTSPKEAVAILKRDRIGLLVTDYSMPEMSGGDLIRRARELNPSLPAIVVSGYAELPNSETLDAPRLAKPFTETQLADMIARVL